MGAATGSDMASDAAKRRSIGARADNEKKMSWGELRHPPRAENLTAECCVSSDWPARQGSGFSSTRGDQHRHNATRRRFPSVSVSRSRLVSHSSRRIPPQIRQFHPAGAHTRDAPPDRRDQSDSRR